MNLCKLTLVKGWFGSLLVKNIDLYLFVSEIIHCHNNNIQTPFPEKLGHFLKIK